MPKRFDCINFVSMAVSCWLQLIYLTDRYDINVGSGIFYRVLSISLSPYWRWNNLDLFDKVMIKIFLAPLGSSIVLCAILWMHRWVFYEGYTIPVYWLYGHKSVWVRFSTIARSIELCKEFGTRFTCFNLT